MQPQTISTEPLHIRPVQVTDADAIYLACQDELIQKWTVAVPIPYERRHAEEFVRVIVPAGWAAGTDLTWAIEEPSAQQLLGVISLNRIAHGSAEVGYWLSPTARGHGVAANALAQVCRAGFERFGLQSIQWRALVGNEASRRVAERVGFEVSGPVRRSHLQRGAWRDGWVGTLLPDDAPRPAPPTLTDGAGTLRPWHTADLQALPQLIDDTILRWTGIPSAQPADLGPWLDGRLRPLRRPQARFALDDEAGRLAGGIDLVNSADGATALGWWLAPSARGRGLAERGVRLALAWAAQHDIARFVADILDGNAASMALALRLGMRPEGLRRGHVCEAAPGFPRRDVWLFALLRTDPGPTTDYGDGPSR